MTDQYELTMISAALQDGTAGRRSVFEGFARRLPTGRRYGVAEVDRVAEVLDRTGQLTAGETSNLESKEASINHEVRADRSLNGGRLTNQEKRIVNQQQNNLSGRIYNDKHNAAKQPYGNNRVDARRENQQRSRFALTQ